MQSIESCGAGRSAPIARTIPDTCAYYGWTRSFTYLKLAAGTLRAVKAGRRTLVTTQSADALYQNLPVAKFGASKVQR